MVEFYLNGQKRVFDGNLQMSLLKYLREVEKIYSVKDGCSGQAACGCCLVELNQNPALSCVTYLKDLNGSSIVTIEGFPQSLRELLGQAFVEKGRYNADSVLPDLSAGLKSCWKRIPIPLKKR